MRNEITLTKIKQAIQQLEEDEITVTYSKIAEICHMTKQGVHQIMKANKMSTGREHDMNYSFLAELDRISTANLDVFQIAQIVGYTKSIARLRSLLHLHGIPCKRAPTRTSVKEKLSNINTEVFTVNELHEMTNYAHSEHSFRSFLRSNRIKFKKVRPQISNQLTSKENIL
jgi:D-serine deaminase-like pyridoxal phosphate-dependent protein